MSELQILYHGNCLDGVMSAAVFTRFFLDQQSPGIGVSYQGMAHSNRDPYGEDHDAVFHAEVNAVMDFRYSPSARLHWWCDHHHTAFMDPTHQRHFEADSSGQKYFDPRAPSCAGLLVRWLSEAFGYTHPLFADHAAWADLVDSASFESPAQAVEVAAPALQLMTLLEAAPEESLVNAMIQGLSRGPIAEVHAEPRIQEALSPVLQQNQENIDIFRARLEVVGGVGSADLTADGVEGFNKFIPYYLCPDLRYTVLLTQSARRAKVSVGSNPWQRPEPLTNIGELCQRYGGGGHPVVGAVTLPPDKIDAARKAYEEICEALRTK